MKRWRGLALGTLTAFLLSAPAADAAEATTAAVRTATVDDSSARDAERAAKAAERAERQAARAAAKAERQRAIAEAKAARAEAKAAPNASPAKAIEPSVPAVGESAAPAAVEPTAATAASPVLTEKEAARLERQQMLAERKADRKAALAAARAEKRAEAAAERAEKKAARAEEKATNKRDRKSRYKTLFVDNGFTYYLDVQNTRWVPRPYNSSEYMIDAWVRLVENTTGEPVGEDGKIRPAKYFLEHYYISPQRHEIMFISELEVTGRPDNAVKERAYDPKNWEQLVPGSIEDALYEAITARMKGAPGSGTGGMSVRDMIEEYARISF